AAFGARDVADLAEALLLELRVADGEHFVHDEDLGLEVRRDGEREAHVHAARVALHRRVEEPLDLGERDDLVELRGDLRAAHPEDRAVQEDVLAARQLRMKARADLEKARDAPADPDASGRRLGDARQDLQHRGLARAVAADDAEDLAAPDLERHVLQRPELFARLAGLRVRRAAQAASERRGLLRHEFAEARRTRLALMRDHVALRDVLDPDDDVVHGQISSAKDRSVRLKCLMPVTRRSVVTASDMPSARPSNWFAPPKSDQRTPSITPTIGFAA